MKIGIIGAGWVGKAQKELFPDALVYTPSNGETREHINTCDVVFIAVPTPVIGEGKLDTSIVEESIKWCEAPLIVVRSTVNPGDCDTWQDRYNKQIVFQPEYLGETPAHPLLDTKQTNFIILGSNRNKIGTVVEGGSRKVIELYQTVYNANIKIRQVNLRTAEVIKLSENRAIAFKVAQCQELYDVCELDGTDYYEVVQAVYGDDPRFNLWWTFVYPQKRGFKSKCIPKDVYAWCAFAESLGYNPVITRAMLERNKTWLQS